MVVIPCGHKDRKPFILRYVNNDARVLFGQRLRQLRKQVGISQEALAHQAGLDRSYVGGVERGEYNISLLNICLLADALNLPPYELLRFTDNKQDQGARPRGR
jgi:transcriptional regulator with XRE-family HTH domain